MSDSYEEEPDVPVPGGWEFFENPPTKAEVRALLETLPPVWGVKTVDFIDYVMPYPNKKKMDKFNERGQKYVDTVQAYQIYMTVPGRVKMLEAAQALNQWEVQLVPEKKTPTGAAGYLQMEQRIVYRVHLKIWQIVTPVIDMTVAGAPTPKPRSYRGACIGSRPGTAHVPYSGGSNAAGSAPYEKVETSAHGRAIAAWGFGVFPGSGIASFEEMQGARQNEQAAARASRRQSAGQAPPTDDETTNAQNVLESILTNAEQSRLLRGDTEETKWARLRNYIENSLGVKDAWDEASQTISWGKLKPRQLAQMNQAGLQSLNQLISQEQPL